MLTKREANAQVVHDKKLSLDETDVCVTHKIKVILSHISGNTTIQVVCLLNPECLPQKIYQYKINIDPTLNLQF